MKDYKFNTYIEWTEEDRKRGECPVPAGSEVTVWLKGRTAYVDSVPQDWEWGGHNRDDDDPAYDIIAYMIHSIPREPREWYVARRFDGPYLFWARRQDAVTFLQRRDQPKEWEMIKVREVMEDDT